jgi:sugar (pentulose or hexulose) kinase
MSYRLVFDVGSKVAKCAIADEQDQVLAMDSIKPAVIRSEDGFIRSGDASTYWSDLVGLLKKTVDASGIDAISIRYITCSSIRPSCIFTDEDLEPLYVGTSFDSRGIDTAPELEDQFAAKTGRSIFEATGHFPALSLIPARYAWFKENEPELVARISRYLPTDSWILAKFGGEIHVNVVSAVESGFYNIQTNDWDDAWQDLLDLPTDFLPPVVMPGEIIGNVSTAAAEDLGLSTDAELVAGTADTQAALIGAGAIIDGDAGIVVGSTTPVQVLHKEFALDKSQHLWTTKNVLKNVLESNVIEASTGITGQIIGWIANMLYSDTESFGLNPYKAIDEDYVAFDAREINMEGEPSQLLGFLGPTSTAAADDRLLPGTFMFPTPNSTEEPQLSRGELVAATFENIQFAVKKNLDTIEAFLSKKSGRYFVLGGMTRNETFTQRFSDLVGAPVSTTISKEATILGLLQLCAVAAGEISSPADLAQRLSQATVTVQPRPAIHDILTTRMARWDEMWQKLRKM